MDTGINLLEQAREALRLEKRARAITLKAEERKARLWDEHSVQWAKSLNHRATVEGWMFDAASGKRPMPTADELRQWALKLGVPDEFRAAVGGASDDCKALAEAAHKAASLLDVMARAIDGEVAANAASLLRRLAAQTKDSKQ